MFVFLVEDRPHRQPVVYLLLRLSVLYCMFFGRTSRGHTEGKDNTGGRTGVIFSILGLRCLCIARRMQQSLALVDREVDFRGHMKYSLAIHKYVCLEVR